ncbi:Gfo/Idh/MocA family protein, partial [Maribacter sp. UBA6511]|uniref:Gfo/Idh/MocA family protein n=1 Tax=Maribacter sp. UBA6511 TaxID=1946805 RepID=UPI0039C99445
MGKTIQMLKVGVLGAGHLGKIHLRLLNDSKKYELIGFYDADSTNGEKVSKEFGYTYFEKLEDLMNAVDVVDIVTPTLSHYECAKQAIEKGKHIFIEKPITKTIQQADELIELAKTKNKIIQVGHIERLNPALKAL